MACVVTYRARPDVGIIQMSNGLTAVFISVLTLGASSLAESDRQREFAAWFASHDQHELGLGVADFDVGELPWSPPTFPDDQRFLLRSIAAAKAKTGWARLGYEPREDWVQSCLDKFQVMIEAFAIEHAGPASSVWAFGRGSLRPRRFVLCPVHQAYEHERGCLLCNDGKESQS